MNFKKIITLLLAFTLTLSLAACGSKGDGKGDGDAQGATAEEIYAQIQELADKENAIMEENLELWQKLFAAMNEKRDEIPDESNYGAYLLAALDLVGDAGALAALGADHLDLAGVDSGLALDNAALLALTAGLDVAGDHVAAFHNDLALAGDGAQHLTLLAAVLAGQDDNGVILLDLQTIHFSGPSIKQLRERGTGSSCNPCRAAHEQRAQRYGYLWGFCRP